MSTIKVDTIQDTSGNEQFTAKAWGYFYMTGTPAFYDSEGASSITDVATGDMRVNLSNAMTNAYFGVVGSCHAGGVAYTHDPICNPTAATQFVFNVVRADTGAAVDASVNQFVVMGDLA